MTEAKASPKKPKTRRRKNPESVASKEFFDHGGTALDLPPGTLAEVGAEVQKAVRVAVNSIAIHLVVATSVAALANHCPAPNDATPEQLKAWARKLADQAFAIADATLVDEDLVESARGETDSLPVPPPVN